MDDYSITYIDSVMDGRRVHKPHRAVSINYSRYGKSNQIKKRKEDKSKKPHWVEQEIYSFPKQGCWRKFMKILNPLCYHKVKRSDSINLSQKMASKCKPSKYVRKSSDEQSMIIDSLSPTTSAFTANSGAPLMRHQSTYTNHTFKTETASTLGSYLYVCEERKYSEF